MGMPLVSIVTPCYNGELYLKRFFCSILRQTYQNLELIFIDDGSTDKTREIVDTFRNALEARGIRFIYHYQDNAGQAAAVNLGLKLCTGEYLTWMDSDDELMPEFIERKIQFLEEHPDCPYCYGKAIVVNEDDPDTIISTCGKRESNRSLAFFEDILYTNKVFFSGYVVRISDLDRVIRGRDIYPGAGGQNAQLLLPLAWYYGEPEYVENSVYKYYVRGNSHSHSLDSSETIIRQLGRYEQILTETLKRIPDQEAHKYIENIKRHYARLKFGNAVDTMRPDLIRLYYREIRRLGVANLHDLALCIKYSARVTARIKKE